jgi:uncharacterized damage-inducible protein DinB
MKETERICRQMEQAVYGEAWHGPCLVEVLQGVNAQIAAASPAAGSHSIWELLAHLSATQQIILDRIARGADSGEEWPSPPAVSEQAWQQSIAHFKELEGRLRRAIAEFPDDRLPLVLKEGGTSAYNNFHGNVQHLAYHIGQIALLKKLAAAGLHPV